MTFTDSGAMTARLIFISGMGAAGKSTLARALAGKIPNAFCVNRDSILYGGQLFINLTPECPNIAPFETYVANDSVLAFAERILTPFGPMLRTRHDPGSDHYARYYKEQSYLIMGRLAADSLNIGKVPILDGFLVRHIKSGVLRTFMDQPCFAGFKKYLIHLVVDEAECFNRWALRAKDDAEALIRAEAGYLDPDKFKKLIAEKHERNPGELRNYDHLLLDTSRRNVEECVTECMSYISR